MRVCVVARRDPTRDPHTTALVFSLRSVGHDVTIVCGGEGPDATPDGVPVQRVRPERPGAFRKALSRIGLGAPDVFTNAVRTAVAGVAPDLAYPVRLEDLGLVPAGVMVARRPEWPSAADCDLIDVAPHDAAWSTAPAGPPLPFHLPGAETARATPALDRHRGVRVAVAGRVTPTNPSRYLIAAMERAGIEVTVLDGTLAWDRVPENAAAVVIVESPYPALRVSADRKQIPVLFWVHHGEHHLPANLRLVARYGADAVLLAHSWHLAHRFPVPVHRFPFAVAPEVFTGGVAFSSRGFTVAMVAAGLAAKSDRYGSRYRMSRSLEAAFGERAAFRYGLLPEEMAALYANSKIVLNDGGRRHLPITMRVFEALGTGALLLTEDLPGTDVLLTRGEHYLPLGEDAVAQVRRLGSDPTATAIARAGHAHATQHHTYDHRVDDLLRIAAATEVRSDPESTPAADPLTAAIAADVEVQTLSVFDAELDLPDRVIRTGEDAARRLESGRTDAVVLASTRTDLESVVAGARRYVYATGTSAADVAAAVVHLHPAAEVTWRDGVMRADLHAPGYRMRSPDHPLAR